MSLRVAYVKLRFEVATSPQQKLFPVSLRIDVKRLVSVSPCDLVAAAKGALQEAVLSNSRA